jgi:hypothetical protein
MWEMISGGKEKEKEEKNEKREGSEGKSQEDLISEIARLKGNSQWNEFPSKCEVRFFFSS